MKNLHVLCEGVFITESPYWATVKYLRNFIEKKYDVF